MPIGVTPRRTSPEDEKLTHVGPGTPYGEPFHRYWPPVALSSRSDDIPLVMRSLDEDLVVFRDFDGWDGK